MRLQLSRIQRIGGLITRAERFISQKGLVCKLKPGMLKSGTASLKGFCISSGVSQRGNGRARVQKQGGAQWFLGSEVQCVIRQSVIANLVCISTVVNIHKYHFF